MTAPWLSEFKIFIETMVFTGKIAKKLTFGIPLQIIFYQSFVTSSICHAKMQIVV